MVDLQQSPTTHNWWVLLSEAELLALESCLGHALGAQDNAMEPVASDEEREFIERLLAEIDIVRKHREFAPEPAGQGLGQGASELRCHST